MIGNWGLWTALNPIGGLEKSIDCRLLLTNQDCTDAGLVLAKIADWLIALAVTLFFIMMLVGGIQYLAGAGNEEQVTKAKHTFTWAIVGLIVVVASWAILKFFFSRLGVQ